MPDGAGREAFLTSNHFCVLGTNRKSGWPRLSPMAYHYEDGKILISTTRTRGGGRTARRDPRVTVCILNPANTREYLNVYGTAEILEDEETNVRMFSYLRRRELQGEELAAVRKQVADEGRIVLRITPQEFFPH